MAWLPYGAVVQLDPGLDLDALALSLPARRILEALQTYGAYVMNTTGSNFNIYTNVDATEFDAHGGVYDPSTGQGVQDQILAVISSSAMFVVPPVVKRD